MTSISLHLSCCDDIILMWWQLLTCFQILRLASDIVKDNYPFHAMLEGIAFRSTVNDLNCLHAEQASKYTLI